MDGQLIFGIAGVGKMGEALVRGLIVGRVVPPTRILVSDAIPPRAREVAAKHGVAAAKSVEELAEHSDILVLAAKPKDMAALVKALAGHVKKDALDISPPAGRRVQVGPSDDEGDRGTSLDRRPRTHAALRDGRDPERDDDGRVGGHGEEGRPAGGRGRYRRGLETRCGTRGGDRADARIATSRMGRR